MTTKDASKALDLAKSAGIEAGKLYGEDFVQLQGIALIKSEREKQTSLARLKSKVSGGAF